MPRTHLGIPYRIAVGVLKPLVVATTRHTWRGNEHLPTEGGVVVCPNHLSYADPVTVAHFLYDSGRPPRFLAKSGIFQVPVVGPVLRGAGQIPVYRESRDATKALAAAIQSVRRGECVVVYPEGTITRDPTLWPMVGKTGAARIALSTGAPVVPVAHWGTQELLAPYAKRPHVFPPKHVRVLAGPPVDLEDLRGRDLSVDVLRQATVRIMAAVTGLLAQLRGEPAPTQPFDPRTASDAERPRRTGT